MLLYFDSFEIISRALKFEQIEQILVHVLFVASSFFGTFSYVLHEYGLKSV